MGKIQCVSQTKSDTWQTLEKYLININTPLDKKIHFEYFSLKIKSKDKISSYPLQIRNYKD